jgi:hypothetical protein
VYYHHELSFVVCKVATIDLSCFTDSTNHSVEALCSQFLLFARGAAVWRKLVLFGGGESTRTKGGTCKGHAFAILPKVDMNSNNFYN